MLHNISISSISNLADTPYPAWALGVPLALRGTFFPKPLEPVDGSSGGSVKFSRTVALRSPTRASCLTFGAAHLLGGYMIYDGDAMNGAGFNFAWSTLYLIVNAKSSIKNIFMARVSPIAFATLAAGNAAIYGKKFFWS